MRAKTLPAEGGVVDLWIRVRQPVLLGLLVIVGVGTSLSAPDAGAVAGLWPVGLATGVVLLAPRREAPYLLAATFVIAAGTVRLAQPLDVALGYGVAATLEVAVAARLLARRRPSSTGNVLARRDIHLTQWLGACFGSALVGGAAMILVAVVVGLGNPLLCGIGVGVAHLASLMLITPFFLRFPEHGAAAKTGERITQWIVIIATTPLLLLPSAAPGLFYLTIPILAWGALRITPWEALAQLIGVVTFATALASFGVGPFPADLQAFSVPDEIHGILLAGYAISCAIMVVPLLLRVGEYIGAARDAETERYLVTNILDSARGISIIVTDAAGRVVLFNQGAERLLGYDATEVIGRSTPFLHTAEAIADKADELGVEAEYPLVMRALISEPAGSLVRVLRKDGVERIHSTTVTQLTDARERPTGYLSTSEDVTDAVLVEEALRAALAAEQRAVERLREVDSVKDTFVSTVSHELRTPITSILGYVELLSDGSLGGLEASQQDALCRVTTNSHRLLALIDDLLTLSKMAESGVQFAATTFDLRAAVEEACAVIGPVQEQRDRLGLDVVLPDADVVVVGDRDMLERVVVNLLSNAVKFTPDGPERGVIGVVLEPDGADVVLRVSDNGIGIPEHEQGDLFTRFFRSSLSQGRAIPGSGLGLSISRSIVERHGGTIEVSSAAGAGTVVEVRLPLAGGNVQHSTSVELEE